MLCHACEGIFSGSFQGENQWPRVPHHKTVLDLQQAALDGCSICDQLWRGMLRRCWARDETLAAMADEEKSRIVVEKITAFEQTATPRSTSTQDISFLQMCMEKAETQGWHLTFGTGPHALDMLGGDFSAYFVVAPCDPEQSIPPFDPVSFADRHAVPLRLAKAWLDVCLQDHPRCSIRNSGWYPTRLLMLDEPEAGRIRLLHTQNKTIKEPYMTLSHCWGRFEFLKLTSQTYPDLSSGLEVSSLPQTFQDAIKVALQMGVKLLWIDSLCIFQDSHEDWAEQSSAMGSVYRNGICNLAATRSKDGDGGLFSSEIPMRETFRSPCYVQSSWTDATNHLWHVYPKYIEKGVFLDGPLLDRGWVVQERIMAPRILHFGSNQLYWECHQYDACEIYPTGLPPLQNNLPELIAFKQRYQPLEAINDRTQLLVFWSEIVASFSQCDLTREEDKLVALSGVAKEMKAKLSNAQYLAGLWGINLEYQLLWMVNNDGDGKLSSRPKHYRAPSWSWTSIDGGPVLIGPDEVQLSDPPVSRVQKVTVEPLGSDPTGQVKSGAIVLKGPLLTLLFRERATSLHSSQLPQDPEVKINGRWQKTLIFRPDVEEPARSLHCMPIRTIRNNDSKSESECLVLQPTGLSGGQFRRFGFLVLYAKDYGIEQWDTVQNEEWLEFEEDHGDGIFTITII